MSVLKNKRSVSSLEFYHNAIMLRREITMLLLRDFGIKDKVRSVKSLYGVPGMEPEDEQKFREIVEKYEMKATIIEEYPAWLIDKMRNNIMNILHNMIMNITQANTIYPVCESEFYDRRNFQNHAIGNCEYNLTETGKVQERISKDSVTRMRRKLKKFRKLMDAGEMSFDDVRCAYASWKGGVSHYDSYNVVKSMDKLFDELFIHPFIGGGHRDEQNNNEQK